MSDLLTERKTLRELIKQPGISIGAGFLALGVSGLVAAVFWLSSLPAWRPSTARIVAEAPAKQAEARRPPDSSPAPMPEQNSIVTRLSDADVERPALLPEAQLLQPARPETQSATVEAAVAAAGPVSEPIRPSEPIPVTGTAAREINAAAPDRALVGIAEPPRDGTPQKGYRLQLGSVRTLESARREWERLESQNGDVLNKLGYAPARVDLGDRGIFYRIQAGPVADAATAERVCKELRQRGVGCLLIKPAS
jgi:cell division septation protein DedD